MNPALTRTKGFTCPHCGMALCVKKTLPTHAGVIRKRYCPNPHCSFSLTTSERPLGRHTPENAVANVACILDLVQQLGLSEALLAQLGKFENEGPP